ncbi:MAG: hypothetical protein AB7N76_16985 [Planctomycetota bacterium]
MGIFDRLFNQEDKEVTSRDLKIALRGVERERRKKQMEIRKLSNKRNEVIGRLKQSRKENNREEVDFLYEDLQQIKMDQAYARRESKILNLEAIGLKRYVRGLERLEKTSSRGKVRDLMQRVQMSGLDEKLRGASVDEEAYLDALNATLEDISMELEDSELMLEEEDPSKRDLLAEIDEIIAAEEGGDVDLALERQHQLEERMDRETAGEAAEGA